MRWAFKTWLIPWKIKGSFRSAKRWLANQTVFRKALQD
jgi:hypothetical protein